ncbi:MAG TPA: hypothetical protein VEW47_17380 [Candidatus Dormibacteraeota bacterium]|nr:hypothetical protein [Candidatus Dormibacteraeota bacterium]
MTLDELLAAAGLTADFLEAMRRRDVVRLQEVLTAVRLDPATIETLLDRPFEPDWSVRVEIARRFRAGDWREATRVLGQLILPFLEGPSRALDRSRVHLAIVRLSAGDIDRLRRAGKESMNDWRDVLVAAGMANGDWRDVLVKQGWAVPGAPPGENEA